MAALSPTSAAALARLRAFKAPPTQFGNLPLTRRAAVLILLFADRRGDLRVVLTIRSAKLKNYAGHAALPGGKADFLSETPFITARREAFEEIGLPLSDDKLPPGYSVEHLTELPTNLAMTELGVRPCVAYLKSGAAREAEDGKGTESSARHAAPARDLLPKLDAKEVAAVFTAPFHNFLRAEDEDEGDRRNVPGKWYMGSWHSWHEEAWRMHQFFVPVVKGGVVKANEQQVVIDHAKDGDDNPAAVSEVAPEKGGGSWDKNAIGKNSSKDQTVNALAQPRYRVFGMTARILVDCARVAYGEDPNYEHNSHFGDEDMMARLLKIGRLSPIKKAGERLTRDVMMAAKLS